MTKDYSITNVVSDGLNDQGLYAIQYAYLAMVGLGRFDWLERLVLYDRATSIAMDVTEALNPDMLNFNQPEFSIKDDDELEYLEDFLTGKKVPEGQMPNFQESEDWTATLYFRAIEIAGDAYNPLRRQMVEVKSAKNVYDAQREIMGEKVMILRQRHLPPGFEQDNFETH